MQDVSARRCCIVHTKESGRHIGSSEGFISATYIDLEVGTEVDAENSRCDR